MDIARHRFRRHTIMVLVVLCLAVSRVGSAHVVGNSAEVDSWFEHLHAPDTGVPCCNLTDCTPVSSRLGAEGWEAWTGGRWIPVPDEKVMADTVNPLEQAVLCWSRTFGLTCFVPPPAGHRRTRGS
jgi:hypothetical protein